MYTTIIGIWAFGLCTCVSVQYDKNMLIQSLYFDSCGGSVTPISEISVSVMLPIVQGGAESEFGLVSSGIQVSIRPDPIRSSRSQADTCKWRDNYDCS